MSVAAGYVLMFLAGANVGVVLTYVACFRPERKVVCPNCAGSGKRPCSFSDAVHTCPRCEGTGSIPKEATK